MQLLGVKAPVPRSGAALKAFRTAGRNEFFWISSYFYTLSTDALDPNQV